MTVAASGHRELEHTADWELEVWAPDMSTLLAEAARGMYGLMGVVLTDGPRLRRRIELEAGDREALLVGFLGELLYVGESEDMGFDSFHISIDGGRVTGELEGASIRSRAKEIKAVTFHRLEIRDSNRGLETRIVFDV